MRRLLGTAGLVVLLGLLGLGLGLSRMPGGPGALRGGGPAAPCDQAVAWHDAGAHVGDHTAVVGPVAATNHEPTVGGAPTFLNLGAAYPEPDRFDVVIYADVRASFDVAPERRFADETVCVTGRVRDRDGVAQIVLQSPADLVVWD